MATHVTVQTLSGKVLEIPAVPTVGELRGLVAKEFGVYQAQIQLACDAQLITDDLMLLSFVGSHTLSTFLVAISVEAILHSIGHSDINVRLDIPRRGTVLHFATVQGNLAFVEAVLKEDRFKLFNETDCRGRTALHIAAQNGHIEIIKAMLADPRICQKGSLHVAAAWGRSDAVWAILADPCCSSYAINSHSSSGTILHEALKHEHAAIAEVLLQEVRFACLNDTTPSGSTALHIAAMHGDTKTVTALLADERFTEVNAVDKYGRSALHRAAAALQDYSSTTKAILESDRFTLHQCKDRGNATALETAIENRCMETAKLLKTYEMRSSSSASATHCLSRTSQGGLVS